MKHLKLIYNFNKESTKFIENYFGTARWLSDLKRLATKPNDLSSIRTSCPLTQTHAHK